MASPPLISNFIFVTSDNPPIIKRILSTIISHFFFVRQVFPTILNLNSLKSYNYFVYILCITTVQNLSRFITICHIFQMLNAL